MEIDQGAWEQAKSILVSGGVVVLPTDTVYGIAAHPGSASAIRRILRIKRRPANKPIPLLAADKDAVCAFGAEFPPAARALAEAYWPGALTLVLSCGQVFEGFRVPNHENLRRLLKSCGGVLRVTSANFSGQQPALSAAAALCSVGSVSDLVIDGGISPGGVASTVVRVSPDNTVEILRESAISKAAILACAKEQKPNTEEDCPPVSSS